MRAQEIPALPASIALFVATCLFQTLFLERGASLYDEGSIISIGVSLSQGDVLYGDIKTFVTPLTYELMGLLYRVFGASMLVGRIFILLSFSLVVVFVHRTLLKLLSPRDALLGAIAIWPIKALAFPLWTIVNYSQVALLFLVGTMLAIANWLSTQRRGWLVVTGLLAGMTVVSKQDFGAHVVVAVGLAVVFGWWIRRPRTISSLVRQVAVLGVSSVLPVAVALSYYAWHGTVGSLIYRTVMGPLQVPAKYGVSFPDLGLWLFDPEQLAVVIFAYFPTVFLEMSWVGDLNVYDWAQLLPLELAIKAAYYLPVLAMVGVGALALRPASPRSPGQRSILLLLSAAAVVAYGLIYRGDWIHLMNLYAITVLPVIVGFALWAAAGRVWRSFVAGGVLLAWLLFGAIATYEICTRFVAPIESVRGRILEVPRTAAEISTILDYLEKEPASSRVLFMTYNSLLYFLSGRPILAPNDLIMPALIADDRDDRELAEAVAKADVVIFNPKIFPTVQTALFGYAPRTATALSSLFDREQELANVAVVLRKARQVTPPIVTDFWEVSAGRAIEPLRESVFWGDEGVAGLPPVFRDHWMVYRVVAMQTGEPGEERCFQRRHCVEDGQWLTAKPSTHPDAWALPGGVDVRFEIRAQIGSDVRVLKTVVRKSSDGPNSVEVPMSPFAGQCVELSFCATPLEPGLPRGAVGWAEPRIVSSLEAAGESPPAL